MKAVVKESPGPGFALRDVPVPEPPAGWVRVRVRAVGICGTDIPIFEGVRKVPYPLIPGHEFAGEVDALGSGVTGWQPGDRVAVGLVIGCGACAACYRGEENRCERITEIGIHINGAFAEYTLAPAKTLHRLPDHLSFADGASVDPVASSYRGIRRLNLQPQDDVAIFGLGPIGLYALQAVRAHGVRRVIAITPRRGLRGEVACRTGADALIESAACADLVEAVRAANGGALPTVIIEATGQPGVFADLLRVAAPGARVLLLGIFHAQATFDPAQIIRKELRVEGSFCYTWDDFAASLDLIARGKVRTTPVITHTLPLTQMAEALDLIHRREAVKVILQP
ncbi:MAG: alcohol dehydrogenase catalytic domain-containing protein [Anaerolineae bacterium]|nr:alcohol dehydrogenase catalytic domain-containing protein [Anaerolineae bacterium]